MDKLLDIVDMQNKGDLFVVYALIKKCRDVEDFVYHLRKIAKKLNEYLLQVEFDSEVAKEIEKKMLCTDC